MEDLIQPWFPEFCEARAMVLSRSLGGVTLPHIVSFVLSEIHPDHCQHLFYPGHTSCLVKPTAFTCGFVHLRAFPGGGF